MKKRYLFSALLSLSALTSRAQTPALTSVYQNNDSYAIDLYSYNIGAFAHGGNIYFLALVDPNTSDVEWVRYNPGTNTYTQVTNNIANGTGVQYYSAVGNHLLFSAAQIGYDTELMHTNLSTLVTTPIEINNGSCNSSPSAAGPRSFIVVPGDKMYFFANSQAYGSSLYLWDAANAAAVSAVTLYNTPGNGLSSNYPPVFANNRLLFGSYVQSISTPQQFCTGQQSYYGSNLELVRMETSNNALTIHDLNTGTYQSGAYTYGNNSDPHSFFEINGRVFFQARSGGNNNASYQLWSYDMNAATPAPQVLTSFTNVQSSGAISSYVWDGANKLYFSLTTYANGTYVSNNIYQLNLTTNAVSAVTSFTSMDEAPTPLLHHGGHVYFSEYNTEDAVMRIRKINTTTNAITNATSNAVANWGMMEMPYIVGTKVFLSGDLGDGAGDELISFDANGGTAFIRHGDVNPGSNPSLPMMMMASGTDLYYFAEDGNTGVQLYKLPNSVTPLPVEWMRFSAVSQQGTALLEWQTASERNAEAFDIQRSTDGRTFETVGVRKAQGTAATYRYTDVPAASGRYHYRIRLRERDGSESFSPVRTLTFMAAPQIAVSHTDAGLLVKSTDDARYEILDAAGRPISRGSLSIGNNQISLDNFSAGLYLLRLSQADGQQLRVEKVVKR